MKNCIAILTLAGACLAQLPIQQPNRNCGTNEQFNSCGSACEPSCANPNPQMCTMQCVVGCQCRQGFFRNAQKQCVPRNQCPNTPNGPGQIRTTRAQQSCGTNEQYTQCGSACQPSCSTPNPTCTLQCVPGCSCRQGFLRNAQRQCVPRNQCPNTPNGPGQIRTTRAQQSCGTNEQYTQCGSACQPSCSTPNPICTLQCVPGCSCRQGFLRNAQRQCVPRNQCPNTPNLPGARTTRSTATTGCATIRCRQGYHCVQPQINCIRTPCPQPPARCEPITRTTRETTNTNPCATTLCPPGKRCVLQQVQCIRAPCNPIPQCV